MGLFQSIDGGLASSDDRRSLLALHAALAARGAFSYLEVGSYRGGSLQPFVADPRCRAIVAIDRRESVSQDERSQQPEYPDNSTAHMLGRLARVPGADLRKLTAIEASTDDVDPRKLSADLCLIDAEHTNDAALRDARFCRRVIGERGVIVFHDRILVDRGIQRFLSELSAHRAYPLRHDLFVVEIGVPSLLDDPRVKAQVPRVTWLVADQLGVMRVMLALAPAARSLKRVFAPCALALGAPRRSRRRARLSAAPRGTPFKIHTFVTDEVLYERMRQSFIDAGFSPDAFVHLSDAHDEPYAAITRIGQRPSARYPILCHQDVLPDRGSGAEELVAALHQLDTVDPHWVVAGNAGVTRSGQVLRRLVDRAGGSTGETPPLPVVTLDENFLVFNGRNSPRCSAGVSGFHLYGSDVCLHALSTGGSAYVIDFPVTHMGRGTLDRGYQSTKERFTATWNQQCLFRYVVTQSDAMFLSRSKILRRLFGSSRATASVAQYRVLPPLLARAVRSKALEPAVQANSSAGVSVPSSRTGHKAHVDRAP
jgi:hypothetical protein